MTVGTTSFDGNGLIAAAKIGAVEFAAEVRGVIDATEVSKEVDGIGTLALGLEKRDRARNSIYFRGPARSH